jgi:hypothetical protein
MRRIGSNRCQGHERDGEGDRVASGGAGADTICERHTRMCQSLYSPIARESTVHVHHRAVRVLLLMTEVRASIGVAPPADPIPPRSVVSVSSYSSAATALDASALILCMSRRRHLMVDARLRRRAAERKRGRVPFDFGRVQSTLYRGQCRRRFESLLRQLAPCPFNVC